MAKWVLDENVFSIASDVKHKECQEALYLTEAIYMFHQLVLDHEGVLLGKYRRFMDQNPVLRRWFSKIIKNANHVFYCSSKLENAVNQRFEALRFDRDDRCFVGAALNADRLVVAEDSDFREPNIAQYLKNELNLEVFSINEAVRGEASKRG